MHFKINFILFLCQNSIRQYTIEKRNLEMDAELIL